MTLAELNAQRQAIQRDLDKEQEAIRQRTEQARKLNAANYASIDVSRTMRTKLAEVMQAITAEETRLAAEAEKAKKPDKPA